MASLYDINFEVQIENLIHPYLRLRKALDYLFSIIYPVQHSAKNILDEYRNGTDASVLFYNSGTTYQKYDKCIFTDDAVYECIYSGGTVGIAPVGHASSSDRWMKVNESYIGAEERQRYNGQLIVLQYAINKKFRITSGDLIYFEHVISLGTVVFEVYFPTAVYTALGSNDTDRDSVILKWLSKYVPAGVTEYTTIIPY